MYIPFCSPNKTTREPFKVESSVRSNTTSEILGLLLCIYYLVAVLVHKDSYSYRQSRSLDLEPAFPGTDNLDPADPNNVAVLANEADNRSVPVHKAYNTRAQERVNIPGFVGLARDNPVPRAHKFRELPGPVVDTTAAAAVAVTLDGNSGDDDKERKLRVHGNSVEPRSSFLLDEKTILSLHQKRLVVDLLSFLALWRVKSFPANLVIALCLFSVLLGSFHPKSGVVSE